MKKLFSRIICMALLLTVFAGPSASASSNDSADAITPIHTGMLEATNLGDSVVLDDGAELTRVSRSDFISQIAAAQNVSVQKAEQILITSQAKKLENNSATQNSTSGFGKVQYYYFNYSKVFHLQNKTSNPYRAELVANLYLASDGQYVQIEDVEAVYTARVSGSYSYDWLPLAAYSNPKSGSSSFPTGQVDLFGDGQFKVVTAWSAGTAASLEGWGFNVSGGGNTIWYSQRLPMQGHYQCYK